MNLRRKTPPDSLYLLLDTLCNAFGGIILLAVLVVLLTSKEKSQGSNASDSTAAMQRRLALAQTNLQESAQLAASLQAKAGDARWKQQMALLSERKDLQQDLQQIHDTVSQDAKDLETSSAADPAERLKFLNSALADAQAQQLEAKNRLAASEADIKRLKQKVADTKNRVAAKLAELQRPLRLPREHDTGKRVMYIIIRYGMLFACHHADMSRNETQVTWTTLPDKDTVEPIPGRGFAPDAISEWFNGLNADQDYVVFCVFEDSFSEFLRAKEVAIANGISYGWLPFRYEDGPVAFSTHGHVPRAQ